MCEREREREEGERERERERERAFMTEHNSKRDREHKRPGENEIYPERERERRTLLTDAFIGANYNVSSLARASKPVSRAASAWHVTWSAKTLVSISSHRDSDKRKRFDGGGVDADTSDTRRKLHCQQSTNNTEAFCRKFRCHVSPGAGPRTMKGVASNNGGRKVGN